MIRPDRDPAEQTSTESRYDRIDLIRIRPNPDIYIFIHFSLTFYVNMCKEADASLGILREKKLYF